MKFNTSTRISIILLLATAALQGCSMKEVLDNCPRGGVRSITVRAYAATGEELTSSEVSGVMLYLFDGDLFYLESISTRLSESVSLDHLAGEDLRIVAWGNLNGNNTVHLTETYATSSIELTRGTRAPEYVTTVDDVFLGGIEITAYEGDSDREIPIYRQMGSLGVTLRGLDKLTGATDDDYRFVVRETFSRIGFDGTLSGDKVSYLPAFRGDHTEFTIDPFNLVPEEGGVAVDIYHRGTLAAPVERNGDGSPISIYRGQTTNVLIEFIGGAGVNVSVSITPWGQQQGWKDF